MPNQQDYQRDQLLTNLSIAYKNLDASFIADSVFPTLPVLRDNGIYYKWDKSNLKAVDDLRAPGTRANEIDLNMSQETFGPLADHEIEIKVTDEQVKKSESPLSPFKAATRYLSERAMINKEVDAAAKLAAATKGTTVASASDRWDDYDNSDPIGMLQGAVADAKKNMLRAPNTLLLGEEAVQPLLNHPDVLARLGDNQTRITRLPVIADLIGVNQVLVGDAQQNTAVDGATDATSYIWGKNAFIMYINPTPALEDVSAGYTLEQTSGWSIDRWYEQAVRSTYVRIQRFYLQQITCQDGIYKLLSVVS